MPAGRPKHQPTKALRDTVMLHARVGTPIKTIAKVLKIDDKTLTKYYRDELDTSLAIANAEVGGHLFNKTRQGDTAAQIFWLKTRAGFKETSRNEITGEDGGSVKWQVEFINAETKDK